ncbi:hypothetical protein [Gordonia sp. DT101]|uniref:glycine-rich domain-containing protein n=1 Tax=Gordonia sp. DT101 TaxID=3416545 RepID=UPI003CEA072E
MPETTQTYTAAGTYTYTIPVWCRYIDVILIGGGASGQTGSGSIATSGAGGSAGSWNAIRLERGVNIPWTITTITITIGAGGARAANSDNAAPTAGSASTAAIAEVGSISANGGSGTKTVQGTNWQVGAPAGNYTFNGVTYTGGAESNSSVKTGMPPGGGGSGGDGGIFGNRTRGWEGAAGGGWVRAYQ